MLHENVAGRGRLYAPEAHNAQGKDLRHENSTKKKKNE